MEIIGHGFLARNLEPIAGAHPGVVVIAAGVSTLGRVPESAYQREAMLVYDVVRRCRDLGQTVVFFSTGSVSMYGAPGCRGKEDEAVFPGSPYGRHKLALETVIRSSGVRYLILRFSHVVGPHQGRHQLLPALVRQVQSGLVEVRRGAGRDLIDVADVVAIIDHLLSARVVQQVVNVASGHSVPIELIVDHLETRLEAVTERRFVEAPGMCSASLEKLRNLVPAVAGMGFGPHYYRYVIDRYVEQMVGA